MAEVQRIAPLGHPVLLNLGCGHRRHPEWMNFDLAPAGPDVRQLNIHKGLPLGEQSADAIYHSHVLEHFSPAQAIHFLHECFRVLKSGGILRVVVPDLEQSARDYIMALDRLRRGEGSMIEPRWLIVEMIDQIARTRPGGQFNVMVREFPELDGFVIPRLGAFGPKLVDLLRDPDSIPERVTRKIRWIDKHLPPWLADVICAAILRRRGEKHLWMYDEFSLTELLRGCGFVQICRVSPETSAIVGWKRYQLDAEPDGTPWKGVSLYLEARRP